MQKKLLTVTFTSGIISADLHQALAMVNNKRKMTKAHAKRKQRK